MGAAGRDEGADKESAKAGKDGLKKTCWGQRDMVLGLVAEVRSSEFLLLMTRSDLIAQREWFRLRERMYFMEENPSELIAGEQMF